MNIEINIINGAPLQNQSQTFQAWFNETIMPNIDFADTCAVRDEWQRPLEWNFDDVKVVAEYFTKDVNYQFNQFLIYGAV